MLAFPKAAGMIATTATAASPFHLLRDRPCLKSLLGFVFNRGVRRGGPRVLLNLACLLFVLLVAARLLPRRVGGGQSPFGSLSHNLWGSIGIGGSGSGGAPADDDDGSVPGGLRIVVFGGSDMGTPPKVDEEVEGATSWTEVLCEKLRCSSHISMVPNTDSSGWTLSSNALYARYVDKVFNATNASAAADGTGTDYSYLSTHYPTQWQSADLADQVTAFLALPRPRHPPRETLWVLSFGLWDVWALSALPGPVAQEAARAMAGNLYAQVERLYDAARDNRSVAWSDPTSTVPEDDTPANATAGEEVSPPPEDNNNNKTAPVEFFRVLVPQILDPSLLPGWRDLRPVLPSPHNKAEQMRNAAELAKVWNDGVTNGLSKWVKTENPRPKQKVNEGEGDEKEEEEGGQSSPSPPQPTQEQHQKQKEEGNTSTKEQEEQDEDDDEDDIDFSKPFPVRDGFAYNGLANYLLEQLLERQLRGARLSDASGRGARPESLGFSEVNAACLEPIAGTVPAAATVLIDVVLDVPYETAPGDIQIPVTPAAPPDPSPAPGHRQGKNGSGGGGGGGPQQPKWRRRSGDAGKAKANLRRQYGLPALSAVRVCQAPGEHLFYTPFALSQRAIGAVGAQCAELVRANETVLAHLEAHDRALKKKPGHR